MFLVLSAAYFVESLERRLKLEVILRQLENDSDRDVRASTNVSGFGDDSRNDETLDTNRTSYLDETIECEPSVGISVPEVVVVVAEDEDNNKAEEEEERNQTTRAGSAEEEDKPEDTQHADQRP